MIVYANYHGNPCFIKASKIFKTVCEKYVRKRTIVNREHTKSYYI